MNKVYLVVKYWMEEDIYEDTYKDYGKDVIGVGDNFENAKEIIKQHYKKITDSVAVSKVSELNVTNDNDCETYEATYRCVLKGWGESYKISYYVEETELNKLLER